jgi:hypothetical protein
MASGRVIVLDKISVTDGFSCGVVLAGPKEKVNMLPGLRQKI